MGINVTKTENVIDRSYCDKCRENYPAEALTSLYRLEFESHHSSYGCEYGHVPSVITDFHLADLCKGCMANITAPADTTGARGAIREMVAEGEQQAESTDKGPYTTRFSREYRAALKALFGQS